MDKENNLADRYAFQFTTEYVESKINETINYYKCDTIQLAKNVKWYAGHPFFHQYTSNLQNADIITDHPPEDWIKWEEKDKIGKIIPVKVNIILVNNDKERLVQLDKLLSPKAILKLSCDSWEALHAERVEICCRLGIDPVSRNPSGLKVELEF